MYPAALVRLELDAERALAREGHLAQHHGDVSAAQLRVPSTGSGINGYGGANRGAFLFVGLAFSHFRDHPNTSKIDPGSAVSRWLSFWAPSAVEVAPFFSQP